ncbi:MAG TPA: hypothetical protein VF855_01390 [Acidimicrobiales bacterium]
MADEGTPIPLVKIYGDITRAPAPDNWWREDVFVYAELLNMGTAPTTAADQIWASLSIGNTVVAQEHEDLDSPAIEPNGGSRSFMFKFDGHYMAVADDWMLIVSVTNADGQISDEQRTEQFSVRYREGQDPSP